MRLYFLIFDKEYLLTLYKFFHALVMLAELAKEVDEFELVDVDCGRADSSEECSSNNATFIGESELRNETQNLFI